MDTAPRYVFLGLLVVVAGVIAAIWVHGRPGTPAEVPLQGAGSTFVYPLMIQWDHLYEKKEGGCKVDYSPTGSGSGIEKLLAGKVQFACTEGPLTEEQMSKARQSGGEVVHVPLVLGAVVPAYNLPELSAPLRLTGPVLADIYLGKIKRWNEQPIKATNPRIAEQLPDRAIVVVHRSDGSGTSFIWTDYLSKVSDEWKQRVGSGIEVKWPAGSAAAGNEGVANSVKKTPGALGYIELSYAYRKDLAFGLVQNREGEFVRAGVESVKAAADNGLTTLPEDLRFSLTNAPGKGSYPICGTSWAVARVWQPSNQGKGRQLVEFLYWVTAEGQEDAEMLLCVSLPQALRDRARAQIGRIQVEE